MVMHATVKAGTKTGKSCFNEQHQHSRRGDNEVRSTVQWDGRTLTRGGSANRIRDVRFSQGSQGDVSRCSDSLHVQAAREDTLQYSKLDQQGPPGSPTDPSAAAAVAEVLGMCIVELPPATGTCHGVTQPGFPMCHSMRHAAYVLPSHDADGFVSRLFVRGVAKPRSHCGCRSRPRDFDGRIFSSGQESRMRT